MSRVYKISRIWLLIIAIMILVKVLSLLSVYNILEIGEAIQIGLVSALVFVTFIYAMETMNMSRSSHSIARASMIALRHEHNWKLYEHEVDPGLPDLPSPSDDKEYWKWRMVHLDHLNLLYTQWLEHSNKLMNKMEYEGLIGWVQLILKALECDLQEAKAEIKNAGPENHPELQDILNFEKTKPRLKALLHISESHNWDLFPSDFVKWLLDDCGFVSLGLSYKT